MNQAFVRFTQLCACLTCFASAVIPAAAQKLANPLPTSPGQTIFEQHCASCHASPKASDRAPNLKTLMTFAPEAVYAAVTTGSMAVPAHDLSDKEKRDVAEYLGGRPLDLTDSGSAEKMANRCANHPPMKAFATGAEWNGWGENLENTRFAPTKTAELDGNRVAQLKLKWAFGFPKGDTAYGQPTVFAGRIFAGSDNGYVYSLNAETGCVYWSFHAKSGVRTSPAVAPLKTAKAGTYAVYFADMRVNAYAVNAATGNLIWTKPLSDHYAARVTGAPVLYQNRLYVPISATEEAFSASPSYACCTFRGSVVALDASTGRQLWKTYMIPEAPKPVRKNSKGVQMWAPAGASVWSAPTIDPLRHALYVGTGDAYTEPAAKTSDAVVALDLLTGKMLWSFQAVKNDAWMVGCVPQTTENCPRDLGVDYDFGSSPILLRPSNGRQLLLATNKSGTVFALDPDRRGAVVWSINLADKPAPNNGEIAFGGATDSAKLYLALEDGKFAAIDLDKGKLAWETRLEPLDTLGPPTNNGENRTKAGLRFGQSAAVTEIPGAVFTGGWDGILRVLSTIDGKLLWQFNTAQDFKTVNGVPAKGGSMGGPGVTVVDGMVYAPSGYANVGGGIAGNVLLAFSVR